MVLADSLLPGIKITSGKNIPVAFYISCTSACKRFFYYISTYESNNPGNIVVVVNSRIQDGLCTFLRVHSFNNTAKAAVDKLESKLLFCVIPTIMQPKRCCWQNYDIFLCYFG